MSLPALGVALPPSGKWGAELGCGICHERPGAAVGGRRKGERGAARLNGEALWAGGGSQLEPGLPTLLWGRPSGPSGQVGFRPVLSQHWDHTEEEDSPCPGGGTGLCLLVGGWLLQRGPQQAFLHGQLQGRVVSQLCPTE